MLADPVLMALSNNGGLILLRQGSDGTEPVWKMCYSIQNATLEAVGIGSKQATRRVHSAL